MTTQFQEIIDVYSGNNTKPINILCGQNADLPNVRGMWYV